MDLDEAVNILVRKRENSASPPSTEDLLTALTVVVLSLQAARK